MLNNPNKTLIKDKISDNIFAISEDDTNEILYSEIQSLLNKEDYSHFNYDFDSLIS